MSAGSRDMEARIIQPDSLPQWVGALAQDYDVIAPVDEVSYGPIGAVSDMHLGADKPVRSPKELVFPEREVLVEYALSADETTIVEPEAPAGDRVLFGARPCDAAAFPIVDQVFGWDDSDAGYFARRENLTVVSIACDEPCSTCFCTSLGGSPAGIEGADLLLTPLRDSYHVQAVTERGSALIERYERFFEPSDLRRNRERATLEDSWREKLVEVVNLAGMDQHIDFDHPVWEKLTQECVDCGICTFLCPTCHCFDIQDEGDPNQGERVRVWDACMFYEYTRTHAGQPRPLHMQRYRQRIMHKFYYYPQNFGRTLCVGCGRCIQHCPVNIDLRAVLKAVQE
jgi:ferredoxin